MTVRWTPTALQDLQSLHAYIDSDNPAAAAGTVDRLLEAISALARHPHLGRRGRVPGTRELVMAPYVIAYTVRDTVVELVAILHGARRWPDAF